MAVEINAQLEKRLRDEKTIWLTTVRVDGTPQSVPVWYLWDGATLLIFSQPTAQKLRNIAQNLKVSIIFAHTDEYGEDGFAVVTGEAVVDKDALPSNQISAYLDKYRTGIADIGRTPEQLAGEFSVAIRVTPTRVRGDG
ncbi:MAG: TIGR03667 family PPOX class F420-dependent oxidoreductase [Chloroflexota bacterium]